jgi:hypothetical protein
MSSQQQSQSNIQAGRNGGGKDTTGMSSQDKQRTDREVNQGKREANR